jgi:5-hydroxyisourate hydrolase-like protein (transthyretin family)
MKLAGTIITDIRGKYSFQPQEGTYAISVAKDGYIFPTQLFAKYGLAKINKEPSRINSHYVGQPINITNEHNMLNIEIPIDPVDSKASLWLRFKIFFRDLLSILTYGLGIVFIPLMIAGTLLSTFAAIVIPDKRNIAFAAIYFIITVIYTISKIIKSSHFSTVLDAKTGKPIPEVVVSLFDNKFGTLKETRMTDRFGRFSISAPKGAYYIKAEKNRYIFPIKHFKNRKRQNQKFYTGETIDINEEKFIDIKILGERKNTKV